MLTGENKVLSLQFDRVFRLEGGTKNVSPGCPILKGIFTILAVQLRDNGFKGAVMSGSITFPSALPGTGHIVGGSGFDGGGGLFPVMVKAVRATGKAQSEHQY